jgi:hypothetical protein
MRVTAIPMVLLMTLALFATPPAKDESIPQLISRADAARMEDRPPLYAEIAERQLHNADQLYIEGKVEEAQAAVQEVVTYSDKASEAAAETGKKLKNTEIALRKMSEKLRDMKRSLAFDDQPPVQAAIDHLEKLRTNLLNRMFGKGPK